jgi:hypothetical protein
MPDRNNERMKNITRMEGKRFHFCLGKCSLLPWITPSCDQGSGFIAQRIPFSMILYKIGFA